MLKEAPEPKTKKNKWGPTQRIDRPRRYPEDGKTVTQRAAEYTKYLNLETDNKPGKSFASLTNSLLDEVASKVNLKMGSDTHMVSNNIEFLKNNELEHRLVFETNNPEINLPSNLDLETNVEDFPALSPNAAPLKMPAIMEGRSWSKVITEGKIINPSKDRCRMEC